MFTRSSSPRQGRPTVRRWIAGAIVVLTIAVAAVVVPAQPAFADTVIFPDQNLEAAVAGTLGVPAGSVTTDDMLRLTSLNIAGQGVQDLSGLEHATNLSELIATRNQITSLTPLAGLVRMTNLVLNQNQVGDLTPLSGMTQLRQLALQFTHITDISALASLTSLENVHLSNNEISDIGPLSGLTSMYSLDIGNNQVTDVGPVAGMSSLHSLYVQSNAVVDVSPLAGLSHLSQLGLSYNPALADISPLADLTSLQNLFLEGTGISDSELTHLSGMSGLTILGLSSNHLSDLTPLAVLTNLQSLYLAQNQIQDLSPLAALANLKCLSVNLNRITDVGPLAGLTNLIRLDVSDNDISQISPLVENAGLATGDNVSLDFNHLDTRAGSQAMTQIGTMVARGAIVTYRGQTLPSDVTAPVTSVNGTDSAWHNHSVALTFSAQDNAGGSGVDHTEYSTNGGATWTRGSSFTVVAEGTTTVSYRSVDRAGNVETTRSVDVKIDLTAPVITMSSPAGGSTFMVGQQVTAVWSVSDALSGVDSADPASTSATLDTASFGQKTFTVSATDEAGNIASQTITYTVAYASGGLMQPVNADGSSIFKAGSTVPLKFSVTDAAGAAATGLQPRLYVARIDDDVVGTEFEASPTCQADTGNVFREVSAGQYQFNLSTKGMATGFWRVRIDLGNGAQMVGYFSLR